MSVRNGIVLLVALSTLLFLAGCGSSNGVTTAVAPPSGGFSNSNLNGTYVFSVSGIDTTEFPYTIVGTFTANGSGGTGRGGITGGAIDINDSNTSVFTTGPIPNVSVNSNSFYSVGVDGRGQATLGTPTNSTPFGNITFDFVLTSSTHGLITEFDGSGSGSGTLDLQASGTTPAGSYAFSFSGPDFASGSPFATVGNFTIGSAGSITGLLDSNDAGIVSADQALSGSVVLGPSSTPATTLITAQFPSGLIFDVFAIDATHLKFIEMDTAASLSGDAFSQTSTTVPTGALAFTMVGLLSAEPVAVGGFMVTDGAGNIQPASTEDVNDNGTVSSLPSFSAQYASTETGRYTLTNFSGFFGGTTYAAYPSSGGLLLLQIDETGVTFGAAYPQSSTTFAASQGYGLNLSGVNLTNSVEVDDIAEFAADSTGTTAIGVIDENFAPGSAPIFGVALSGTYAAPDSNGRGQIAATAANGSNSTLNGGVGLTFYTVDGTTFPFIETDSNGQIGAGVFVLQNPSGSSSAAQSHMFVARPLVRLHSTRQKKQ